jgi:ankyrin repeat protein
VEFRLPSARRERRSRRAAWVRSGTIAWLSLPVLMLAGLLFKRLPDRDSRFDLFNAASDGRRAAVLRKLDSGWSVNSSNLRGQTLLMNAIAAGDLPFARELVARRANVNAQDSDGNTALLLALVSRRSAEAEMLIANGASVDIQNEAGRTALFPAAMHGDSAMCKLLLAHGADRTHRDAGGKTALQYAEEEGQAEVVALLR